MPRVGLIYSVAHVVSPGEPVPPAKQADSKKELPDTVREKIEEFFLSNSVTRASPNRTVKVNKDLVPVRLLTMTVSKAFSCWNETPGNPKVSEASLGKYMPPERKGSLFRKHPQSFLQIAHLV
jgi:hypothetical protein